MFCVYWGIVDISSKCALSLLTWINLFIISCRPGHHGSWGQSGQRNMLGHLFIKRFSSWIWSKYIFINDIWYETLYFCTNTRKSSENNMKIIMNDKYWQPQTKYVWRTIKSYNTYVDWQCQYLRTNFVVLWYEYIRMRWHCPFPDVFKPHRFQISHTCPVYLLSM